MNISDFSRLYQLADEAALRPYEKELKKQEETPARLSAPTSAFSFGKIDPKKAVSTLNYETALEPIIKCRDLLQKLHEERVAQPSQPNKKAAIKTEEVHIKVDMEETRVIMNTLQKMANKKANSPQEIFIQAMEKISNTTVAPTSQELQLGKEPKAQQQNPAPISVIKGTFSFGKIDPMKVVSYSKMSVAESEKLEPKETKTTAEQKQLPVMAQKTRMPAAAIGNVQKRAAQTAHEIEKSVVRHQGSAIGGPKIPHAKEKVAS